jgi:hypothetical protein
MYMPFQPAKPVNPDVLIWKLSKLGAPEEANGVEFTAMEESTPSEAEVLIVSLPEEAPAPTVRLPLLSIFARVVPMLSCHSCRSAVCPAAPWTIAPIVLVVGV